MADILSVVLAAIYKSPAQPEKAAAGGVDGGGAVVLNLCFWVKWILSHDPPV